MQIPNFLKILPLTWTGNHPRHQRPISAPDPALSFEHRHAFVAHPSLPNSFTASGSSQRPPQILFNDVLIPSPPSLTDPRSEDYTAAGFNLARLRTRKQRIARPKSNTAYQIARRSRTYNIEWDEDAPDVREYLRLALTWVAFVLQLLARIRYQPCKTRLQDSPSPAVRPHLIFHFKEST